MLPWIFLALVVGLLAFIRLAPTDPARWHKPITASENKDMAGGAIRVIDGDMQSMERLVQIAEQTPRTQKIAGSVEEGLVTFQTRSLWIGFPDFTTVQLVDGQIRLFARLKFGRSDFGVNRLRLESWINQLNG